MSIAGQAGGVQYVDARAAAQREAYRIQPDDVISNFNREQEALEDYRGRQVLELLQNADDAADGYEGSKRVLFRLEADSLLVANTGAPFEEDGVRSLLISDNSPKKFRARCIGSKGLGFRSVLSWSRSPLVVSGPFIVGFSARAAERGAKALAAEAGMEHLRSEIEEYERMEGVCPAAILRFPEVPPAEDVRLRRALAILEEGYDTAIVLPLEPDRRGATAHADIREQLDALSGEVGVFCQHLEEIRVEDPEAGASPRFWLFSRQEREGSQQLTIESVAGEGDRPATTWRVYRRQGRVPDEHLPAHFHRTPAYELGVAIPEVPGTSEHHRLCVYFPTDEALPMPVLAHATLDLSGSRKRLTNHEANRYVLRRLADLIAEVVEGEASADHPDRALRLLAGLEACDPELVRLGFQEALCEGLRDRPVFPRLGGGLGCASEVREILDWVWFEIDAEEVLPEILAEVAGAPYAGLIQKLGLSWYEPDELSHRLERWIPTLPPRRAGRVVGLLASAKEIPRRPLPPILISDSSEALPVSHAAFLPAADRQSRLPGWVSAFGFLHPNFVAGIQEAVGETQVRSVRDLLRDSGYTVDEYQLEGVARQLAREARRRIGTDTDSATDTWRDVLGCLYPLARDQGTDVQRIDVPVEVVTTRGGTRAAREAYLGPGYRGGDLLWEMYGPLGQDEFTCAPEALGIEATEEQVRAFLLRLGVADRPRMTKLDFTSGRSSTPGLEGYEQSFLMGIPWPNSNFGAELAERSALRDRVRSYRLSGLVVPDRMAELLERGRPEAVVAFLLGFGLGEALERRTLRVGLSTRIDGERRLWHRSEVDVPNPTLHILQANSWVPAVDGLRYCPTEIVISKVAGRAFRDMYHRHAIETRSDLLRECGGRPAVDRLLVQLGALDSFDSLESQDLYELLLSLPERDPLGRHAPGIYQEILESDYQHEDSPSRARFLAEGRLWGTKGDAEAGYYAVSELRHLRPRFLPDAVLRAVPAVAIRSERLWQRVRNLFGVEVLKRGDYTIELDEEGTTYQPWSGLLSHRIAEALPYLYALRRDGGRKDSDRREANRLLRAKVHACQRVSGRLTLFGGRPVPVEVDRPTEGFVIGSDLFIVSHDGEAPLNSPLFWESVGALFADLLERAVGSDFASILQCATNNQRIEMLRFKAQSPAEELLATARAELSLPEEGEDDEAERIVIPPPVDRETAPSGESGHGEEGAPEDDPDAEAEAPSGEGSVVFVPTRGPKRRTGKRRKLVVRGKVTTPRTPRRRTTMAGEDQTLAIAQFFEFTQGRFPLEVAHVTGSEGLGCDVISFASRGACARAKAGDAVDLASVARFIEVKGRSSRTGAIELTENEYTRAKEFGSRYFIYRVYLAPGQKDLIELGVLQDPVNSSALHEKIVSYFDVAADSDTDWFEVVDAEDSLQ